MNKILDIFGICFFLTENKDRHSLDIRMRARIKGEAFSSVQGINEEVIAVAEDLDHIVDIIFERGCHEIKKKLKEHIETRKASLYKKRCEKV